jgi:hypothetical protein
VAGDVLRIDSLYFPFDAIFRDERCNEELQSMRDEYAGSCCVCVDLRWAANHIIHKPQIIAGMDFCCSGGGTLSLPGRSGPARPRRKRG